MEDKDLTFLSFYDHKNVILRNEVKREKRGQLPNFNGIGPGENHWSTKIYKFFLLTVFNREKSFFYEAGVAHDFQYWRGNTRSERRTADWAFLFDMLKLINCNLRWYRIMDKIRYALWAFILFLIVRIFGFKHYNFGIKKTYKDLLRILQ